MYVNNKYDWLFPGVSGIIIIISLLSPAAYRVLLHSPTNELHSFEIIWICDLYGYSTSSTKSMVWVFPNISHIISSIYMLISILILIIAILFIINAIKLKRERINYLKSKKLWFKLMSFLVILTITWIILMQVFTNTFYRRIYDELPYYEYKHLELLYKYGFWCSFSPGFGIIGLFFSALIILIRIAYNKSIKRLSNILYISGGIITLISFFTPAVNYYGIYTTPIFAVWETFDWIWIFSFRYSDSLEIFYGRMIRKDFTFDSKIFFNIPLMVCSISLLFTEILVLIFAFKVKKFRRRFKRFWVIEMRLAIMLFSTTTIWLLIIEMTFNLFWEYIPNHSVKSQPILGFGIIGPYISAFLIVIGIFLDKSPNR